MISADTMYVPALLAPHPDWQGSYDQDGPMAIGTRRMLVDRIIADKIAICGSHFPFPAPAPSSGTATPTRSRLPKPDPDPMHEETRP